MSKHIALISKTRVVNIVVVDDGADPSFLLNDQIDQVVELAYRPDIGDVYDGATFSPAAPVKIVDAKLDPSDVTDLSTALTKSGLDPARIAEIAAKLDPPDQTP